MCHINRSKHCRSIIRVNVGDEFCFHLKVACLLCPVFQSQVNSTRAQVGTANTNLHCSGEFLSCSIGNLTIVYLGYKLFDFLLLCHIKFSLVHTICNHILTKLASA